MTNVYKKIKYEVKDNIAYVGFGYNSDKAMTTLDKDALQELEAIVDEMTADKTLKGGVFHTLKDRCFLAGVDINLISGMKTVSDASSGAEMGQVIYNKIEDLKFPTVAAVHGVCLGGGMELTLACKTIICSDAKSTSMGLPEVKLGVLPGFGGTYRMPKKIGLPKALDLILSGKGVNGKKAKRLGLVEAVYPKERLLTFALKHMRPSKENFSIKQSIGSFAQENFLSKKIIFQKARESVLKKTKGFYQAPLKILDVMESGMMKSRSSYLSLESQAFGELCMGVQSQNLQHLFFMMEGVKKYNGPLSDVPAPALKRGAVLGAGTMGGGIAWLMSDANMNPKMKDLNYAGLELGLKQASSNFKSQLKRRKITQDEFDRKQRSIHCQLDYSGFKSMDLVIEAVVENIEIKKKVFSECEKEVNQKTLITSNTSSLSVVEMAKALEHPERFAGLHFFNPVHKMPLVEIITHDKLSPENLQALYNWVLKIKKTPVIVKDGPGFLVNRILLPYLNEAGFLLEEGVSIEDLDNACLNFGMPMGPCRLLDEVGIDVAVKVAHILHDGLGDRAKPCTITENLYNEKFLGRKNAKGFYLYDEAGKVTGENPALKGLLPAKRKKMDETEIQMRVFLPMINESSYILQDQIVSSAAEVDLGLIFGIGFPPFRGGLLKYADHEGPQRIYDTLIKFKNDVNEFRYAPSKLFEKMIEDKKKFYDH